MKDPSSLLSLLQFSDGLFPAGGYAHSFGLETYVSSGAVTDRRGLESFLIAYLEGSAGPGDAVAVVLARAAGEGDAVALWIDLDERLDAMKPAAELREASRQMGRQTLRVAAELNDDERLRDYLSAVDKDRTPGHHAVVFGAAGSVFGWEAEAAAAAYLYASAAVVVNAALRLFPFGQREGQRLLSSMAPRIARLAGEALTAGELWGFAPGIEIAGMQHARLDARLFRS